MKNKSKNKRKLKIFGKIIILIILIAIIFSIVFLSGIFKVKSIEISIDESQEDGDNITISEIENLSGISINQNLFEISGGEIKSSIYTNSYVNKVTVSKSLNGTVSISVEERKISYLINYAGSYIYISNGGYVLEINSEAKDVPVILGTTTDFSSLTSGNDEKITRLNEEDLEKLSTVNNIMEISKNNDIDGLISRIDISDDKDYIIYLDSEDKTVYLGDCSDLNTRILWVKAIIQEEAGITGEIFVNGDLNEDYVYFRESV